MRRTLASLVMAVLLSVSTAIPAAAWSQENNAGTGPCSPCVKWPNGGSGSYYLYSSITTHASWPTYIAEDVAQYNNISLANNPTWSRTTSQSSALVEFSQESLALTLCGKANFSWTGSNTLYYGIAKLSTNKSYGGRNGFVGDCDFDWSVLHEFGHTQALGHSGISSAIMYSNDNGRDALQTDDVAGIRGIY